MEAVMALNKKAPSAGWVAGCYYEVEMQIGSWDTPVRAILYVTTIVDCKPGHGSVLFNPELYRNYQYDEVSSVQVICELLYNHNRNF
jgi:hypothetical protein